MKNLIILCFFAFAATTFADEGAVCKLRYMGNERMIHMTVGDGKILLPDTNSLSFDMVNGIENNVKYILTIRTTSGPKKKGKIIIHDDSTSILTMPVLGKTASFICKSK